MTACQCVQVSLLIENLVLGQSRALERAHLDPDRHMEADIMTEQATVPEFSMPEYSGDADERSAPARLRLNADTGTDPHVSKLGTYHSPG